MNVCCIRNSRKLSLKKILFTNARLFFKLDFKFRLNSFRTGCLYAGATLERSQLYLEKFWHANIASVLPRQGEFLLNSFSPSCFRIVTTQNFIHRLSLSNKRFRVVSEQRKTEERDLSLVNRTETLATQATTDSKVRTTYFLNSTM